MGKPLVLGNWKMHGTQQSAYALALGVVTRAAEFCDVDVGLCPPFVHIPTVAGVVFGSAIRFGAQNVSEYGDGAFTGEIAANMLRDLGCTYVLVGHSERRQVFGESSATVVAKYVHAHAAGLCPVLCVGETLAERQANATEAVIEAQLEPLVARADAVALFTDGIIAYEPVWAIGTGETATPEQAQSVHAFIRRRLTAVGPDVAQSMRIVYGGSVKPGNANELFAMPDVDGGLIGGAALKIEDFVAICASAEHLRRGR